MICSNISVNQDPNVVNLFSNLAVAQVVGHQQGQPVGPVGLGATLAIFLLNLNLHMRSIIL